MIAHSRRRACGAVGMWLIGGAAALMPGAPGAPGASACAGRCWVSMVAPSRPTVEGVEQQLSSQPVFVDAEVAMADDRRRALEDANAAPVVLPPHEQLALDPKAQERYDKMLEDSYEQCRKITAHYAKTFYFGTKFFDEPKRKAVWAVYAWCRRTDDIVDKPRKDTTSLRDELAEWTARLKDIWQGVAHDAIDLALVDTVRNYPGLTVQPFEDMVKGMVMDLDQVRHIPPVPVPVPVPHP